MSWLLLQVQQLPEGVVVLGAVVLAAAAGLAAHAGLFWAVRRRGDGEREVVALALARFGERPLQLLLPLLLVSVTASTFLPEDHPAVRILAVLVVAAMAWSIIALSRVPQEVLLERFRIDVADNLQARKLHTQIDLVRKIFAVVVVIVTAALILMAFESFRALGTGLLASAGIAGLVIGFAAQRTLANLLAGFQIALTQPIRIDDVVVVEGEWGRIEEITLTYVVVRIWDLRRLILPISYFIENPFQNWTRTSAAVLGTVFLHVDYTVPVEDVRQELKRILEESPQWDGAVCVLHVTDARDRTVELRALMSAEDSGTAWELRCHVRERLLEFVRTRYPEGLPKVRADVRQTDAASPVSPGARSD